MIVANILLSEITKKVEMTWKLEILSELMEVSEKIVSNYNYSIKQFLPIATPR